MEIRSCELKVCREVAHIFTVFWGARSGMLLALGGGL